MTRLELSQKMIDAADKVINGINEIVTAMTDYDKISGNPDVATLKNAVSNFNNDVQRYTTVKMGFNLLHMVNSMGGATENTEM